MSKVLTIILNWRTPDMTLRAVERTLQAMQGIEGEIIVVDNASGDGSEERIGAAIHERQWADRVRLLQAGRNGGYGAGNNVGILAGLLGGERPDYIYLLNSDAFPEADAIRALRDHLDTNRDVGIVGSYVYGEDQRPHTTLFRFPSILSEFETAARTGLVSRLLRNSIVPLDIPTEPVTKVDWVAGCSVMIREEVLETTGLFDETFFLYFEETELCLRAARARWQCDYLLASRVMHIGSASTGMGEWERTPRYWFDSRMHYFRKGHGAPYAALATLSHAAGGALWRLRCAFSRKPVEDPPLFLKDLISHYFQQPPRIRPVPKIIRDPS